MPFSQNDAQTFASALLAARQPGASRAALPQSLPATDAEAYAVQDIVRAALGPTEGWKVGAANPTATPNCSPVLKGGVIECKGSAPLSVPVPRPTGIETEIAFRMARAFPASAQAPSADEIIAGIGSAHVAMELCAARLQAGLSAPPLASLADNGLQLGFMIGPEVKDWRGINAQTAVARAIVDNAVAVESSGGHSQKDIGALLVWLVQHVVTKRGGLPSGAIIATGSWTSLQWVEKTSLVAAEFPGLGKLEARLVM